MYESLVLQMFVTAVVLIMHIATMQKTYPDAYTLTTAAFLVDNLVNMLINSARSQRP